MELTSWLQLALVCLLGAMSPGPSLAVVIGNSLSFGRSYGVFTSLGHGVGIAWWAMVTAFGLVGILAGHKGLLVTMQLLGTGLIIYIGLRSVFSSKVLKIVDTQDGPSSPTLLMRAWIEGFLLALFNPKIAIFFLAIFSQLVDSSYGWQETGLMGVTAATIDALWYIVVSIAVTGAGVLEFIKKRQVIISRISGTILIVIGLNFFLRMATTLI
ncbi:LysE family translocator [SAR202 cluster bacterium AC-409-J13_OGT_754m]|nr:LysE family translocator [SAR202 cluster bacterium AC-409-J13_OGT_754m]